MYSEKQRDIDNIQALFFSKVNVSEPIDKGGVHQTYIVEEKNGKKSIFRFSSKKTALENIQTSQILRKYNIPVPNIGVYKIGTKFCEIYPFIEGQTLHEKHNQGLSKEDIEKIYRQIYDICLAISKIPTKEFQHLTTPVTKTDRLFQIMNLAPLVVGHNDLHDKNILIDDNNNVCGILDLDSISIKPFSIFLVRLFEKASEYGYNIESIKSFDEKTFNNNNRMNIKEQTDLYYKLRNILNKYRSYLAQQELKIQ